MTHLLLAAAALTMRLDYYHTGNATQEHFSVDRVIVEPMPWSGNPARPIDVLDRGNEPCEELVRECPGLEAAPDRLVGRRPDLVRPPAAQQLLAAEGEA